MFKRIVSSGFHSWAAPLLKEWRKRLGQSLWVSVITFAVLFFLVGKDEMSLELRVALAGVIGVLGYHILMLIWTIVKEPFTIIRQQDEKILALSFRNVKQKDVEYLARLIGRGQKLYAAGERSNLSNEREWWAKVRAWRSELVSWVYENLGELGKSKFYDMTNKTDKTTTGIMSRDNRLSRFDRYLFNANRIRDELESKLQDVK